MPDEVGSFEVDERRSGTPFEAVDASTADTDELVRLYRAMVLTRTFDAKAVALQRTGRSGTFASSLGQEAVAIGVAAAMADDDVLVPSFREQGAQLLRGVEPVELFLYWGGDERGSDFEVQRRDFPTGIPIGTHVAHAVGVALAMQLRGSRQVVVCVFGDGATSRGDVYASMNYAGIRRAPVVFVVNNNQWAISVPRSEQSAAETLAQKAAACGFDGVQVDGNDVSAVRAVVGEAIERARGGGGPVLVEALTYRLADHTTADDASRYRADDEVSAQWKNDPVARLRDRLVEAGVWGRDREEQLLAECSAAIEAAVVEYEQREPEGGEAIFDHLYEVLPAAYAAQRADVIAAGARPMGEQLTLVEAVRVALARAMGDDENVLVLGEDVGTIGGVFRATDGLAGAFGPDRVLDMPISESIFVGLAVGLSTQGFRPVLEYQFMGFLYPGLEQLACHASRMRTRTRGRLTCPLVVRAPYGGGVHAPEHHSESFEAAIAHIPGLRVVIPSSPAKAYGLLLASIADPDPVVFLEPKRLYRATREGVVDDGAALPLDRCFTLRDGSDLTMVTWGASTVETLAAADRLAADGIGAEVIDVATIKPLDMTTILESVSRTGRCVIVHEAPRSGGVGAEIAASLADEGLTSLLAPVTRVTGYDTVPPLYRLEQHHFPTAERVFDAARRVLEFT